MVIREAKPGDAEAMSTVLIASITELCSADHGDDPAAIAAWTANKSPQQIRRWFDNTHNRMFVAEGDSGILGVGGFNDGGEVILNYVAPSARFRGVTRSMLDHIEAAMKVEGLTDARLDSTATAHRLYLAAGWQDKGAGPRKFCRVPCVSMTKILA
jgi:GNAT superfamily N-acetyltransferase